MHFREDIYPQPEEFRPERFLDGAPESYAWIPFGGGVRRCIGASFAQFEMRVIIRAILERAELRASTPRRSAPGCETSRAHLPMGAASCSRDRCGPTAPAGRRNRYGELAPPLDVHPIAAAGFGSAADAYERGRPEYPSAAIRGSPEGWLGRG